MLEGYQGKTKEVKANAKAETEGKRQRQKVQRRFITIPFHLHDAGHEKTRPLYSPLTIEYFINDFGCNKCGQ